jgi:hypothetical protein
MREVVLSSEMPQLYSRDYYVRMPKHEVERIVFEHLYTEQDGAVLQDAAHLLHKSGRKAGCTEWYGMHDGLAVSIGWDWAELEDGDIRALKLGLPRTNAMVTDAQGYDMPAEISASELWSVIDSLAWPAQVRRAI